MASHEAAHINHARRPPAQTEFGSAFFIPFPGLCIHIADAGNMVQKHPGSCCAGSLDQRNIRGISARDMKGKRPFRLVLLVVIVYHQTGCKSMKTSIQGLLLHGCGRNA